MLCHSNASSLQDVRQKFEPSHSCCESCENGFQISAGQKKMDELNLISICFTWLRWPPVAPAAVTTSTQPHAYRNLFETIFAIQFLKNIYFTRFAPVEVSTHWSKSLFQVWRGQDPPTMGIRSHCVGAVNLDLRIHWFVRAALHINDAYTCVQTLLPSFFPEDLQLLD